jgi:hypothetical protein
LFTCSVRIDWEFLSSNMQCLSRSHLLRLRIQMNAMMLPRRRQVHLQSYLTNLAECVPPPPHQVQLSMHEGLDNNSDVDLMSRIE